ncbi:hypothetical protein HHK36_016104 [Tetracentron sinense]|uniref:Uncharacterized protein n=1 Tax=Tetracentron sinense TaxID=13715 RepID=A0A834YZK0_TETSI|nr:hypothetical protein HHK36_016104 [Tetracentron sinense]
MDSSSSAVTTLSTSKTCPSGGSKVKLEPEDGEGESRTTIEAAIPIITVKAEAKEEPMDVGVYSEHYFPISSVEEMFNVDELLGTVDTDGLCGSGLRQEWNYDSGQLGLPGEEQLQCGRPSDLSYQLQNPDAKLLGSLYHMDQAPSGMDYSYDFFEAGQAGGEYNFELDEQGLLEMGFPYLGFK